MEGWARLVAVLAVLAGVDLLTSCGDASSEQSAGPSASEAATSATDPATGGGISELPVGDPPATDHVTPGATTEIAGPVDGLERIWVTPIAVLGLEPEGVLVVLGNGRPGDAREDRWRSLTAERSVVALPDDVAVDGVVAESPRTVLVDATDSAGNRAWVRCHVGLLKCALAAELDPEDELPE